MKDYILDVMKAGQKGLYLCELPTGYGKTYNAVQAMKAWGPHPYRDATCLTGRSV